MYTNNKVGNVIYKVIEYFGDDVRRINHFLKVYGYVKMIGECENLDVTARQRTSTLNLIFNARGS